LQTKEKQLDKATKELDEANG